MPLPHVSVCVPTYNGSAYLQQTLHSIAQQTFQNYEVIIVDDQSTDDTLAIAMQYAAADSRVRVFSNAERAGSSARNANRCICYAQGAWIKLLFQDDIMAPACLARMLEAGCTGRFVVCWHDYRFEPGVDDIVRSWYENLPSLKTILPMQYASVEAFCSALLKQWNMNWIGPSSTCLIKRECFTQYGLFSPDIVTFPDLEYWIRIGSREGLTIVPERLVTFRVHGKSISATLRSAGPSPRDLEPLLLLLLLAYAPGYESVRRCASSLTPPSDVDAWVTRAALSARWHAIDARYRLGDNTRLDHWRTFCRKHPEISDVLRRADASGSLWTSLKRHLKSRL
ncbi:MAG TPA: glycosyltransferase family 2 protein [Burkholderiales bacterium]|nr:glycosyltransferase family 2 protein [Burkholderiales bacterium]